MKPFHILMFSLMILMSCKPHKKPKVFDYIDLSFYNGWTDYYSVKILASGETFIFNDRFKKGQTFLKYQFNRSSLDSIERLTRLIQSLKLDTTYERHCQDCGMYNLIIKYDNKKLKLYVYGISESIDSLRLPNNLVNYILEFSHNFRDSAVNNFKFESRSRQFYPPPPPPAINY